MNEQDRKAGTNRRIRPRQIALAAVGLVLISALIYLASKSAPVAPPSLPALVVKVGSEEVQLSAQQAKEMDVGPVVGLSFESRRDAIGIIDLNQNVSVQVFSPYQGRIARVDVQAGDDVTAGQVLYTVQIPDLSTAASLLISTSGTLKVANQTLQRAQSLFETQSISLKELQQNTADQQAADASFRAARKTLALFGLTNRDIETVEATRKVDTEMVVRSPFAGRVTARAGSVGQLVQPGTAPAPMMVANLQTLWMVASVPESELASYKLGQPVVVKVAAYPDAEFVGKVTYIADMADPNSHRFVVRADVANSKRLLKPQMLANFNITLGKPTNSVAVPINAVTREGDGSMSVWVTQEGIRFKRRKVHIGLTQGGMVQIIDGLVQGEKIARDKALFLSNLNLTSIN